MAHILSVASSADTRDVCAIDRFSFFQGALHISGHFFSRGRSLTGLAILLCDGRIAELKKWGLPSPHLTSTYGRDAAAALFDDILCVGDNIVPVMSSRLQARFADGSVHETQLALTDASDFASTLLEKFFNELGARPPGHMLEIGSRPRTGAIYTSRLPPGWRYTGLDILDGPNVDVVGDAHRASTLLPNRSYDAVMSFAVFEHLLMPWKVVIEINRLLCIGGVGIVLAPQTWPLHEEPCDYFRFSRHAWKALFNRATGFEILDAVHGGKAYVVPHNLTAASAFGEWYTATLMTGVLFRKVAETNISWPVELDDIAADAYPA